MPSVSIMDGMKPFSFGRFSSCEDLAFDLNIFVHFIFMLPKCKVKSNDSDHNLQCGSSASSHGASIENPHRQPRQQAEVAGFERDLKLILHQMYIALS